MPLHTCPGKTPPAIVLCLISSLLSACGTGSSTVQLTDQAGNNIAGTNTTPANQPPTATAVKRKVSLSWTPPSTRIDNSPVVPSEIGGYRVYYGNDSTQLQLLKEITDPTQTTMTTQDLAPGTYYFAIAAFDSFGTESKVSNIVQQQIL